MLKVLELYSGIGGMHVALQLSGVEHEVKLAVDINTNANLVYAKNFDGTKLKQANIECISVAHYDALGVDTILMSPPCQPFTRVGQKLDIDDPRCKSFLHVIDLIDRCQKKPTYILLENVACFEVSQARRLLMEVLERHNYYIQEFLVSPYQLGVPNSRLRYYMLASSRRLPLDTGSVTASSAEGRCHLCSMLRPYHLLSQQTPTSLTDISETRLTAPESASSSPTSPLLSCRKYDQARHCSDRTVVAGAGDVMSHGNCEWADAVTPLSDYLSDQWSEHTVTVDGCQRVSDSVVSKYGRLMDIVTPHSTRSCCFTKAYGKYVEGTGSVLQTRHVTDDSIDRINDMKSGVSKEDETGNERQQLTEHLKSLNLRYFTPSEIAALMGFPKTFSLSEVGLTTRQQYQLLGNSLNCFVVSVLIKLLTKSS